MPLSQSRVTVLTAAPGASALTVAVVGDYGNCRYGCLWEQGVADMVHAWHPDLILTLGDNSYDRGACSEVAADQQPYVKDVQSGRFFAVAGNHDWLTGSYACSSAYFHQPPHYVLRLGANLMDVFATDMNWQDPAGDTSDSRQAAAYRGEVAASGAEWKVTASHQPFYSSGEHGSQDYTHWAILPAIDLFLSGHDHDFEYLRADGRPFVVNGAGGDDLKPMCAGACQPESLWQDSGDFGAVRLDVSRQALKVTFMGIASESAAGRSLFSFTLHKPQGNQAG